SAQVGDGKSSVAAGLALSLARSGVQVILVDTNFENPTLHEVFNVKLSPGLSEHLGSLNADTLSQIMRPTERNLNLITAGERKQTFSSVDPSWVNMLTAEMDSDVIIFDTPSADQSATALGLLNPNAFFLIVVRLGHTQTDALQLLAAQMKHQDVQAAGIVLTDADEQALASAATKSESAEANEPTESVW